MNQKIMLQGGGEVQVRDWLDDSHVTLESEHSAPPGSTLWLEVLGAAVSLKVRTCRRGPEPIGNRFQIQGRFVNLSREHRSFLKQRS